MQKRVSQAQWVTTSARSGGRRGLRRQALVAVLASGLAVSAAAQDDPDDNNPEDRSEVGATDADAAAAAAGGLRLDPVVVSATRTPTVASQLTRSVTVIEREELARQAQISPNLSTILAQEVPGLSPSTQAASTFGQTLRGRQFLTLIDGVPITTTLRATFRELNSISVEAIERIEVVRGGSAVYGFGATGGLVNIITRQPEPGTFNARSEVGFGISTEHADDSLVFTTSHQVSGATEDIDYLLSGSFADRDSFFDADGDRIPPGGLGVQGGFPDTHQYDLLGKLGYNFDGDTQRLELTVNYYDLDQDTDFTFGMGNPAAGMKTPAVDDPLDANDPQTENLVTRLGYEHNDILGSRVEAQVYYTNLEASFGKFPGFPRTLTESEKHGARTTIETPFAIGELPVTATYGIDYLHDTTDQGKVRASDPGFFPGVPELEQNALAGFLQLESLVSDWLLLRGGVRHERIDLDVEDVVNAAGRFIEGGELDFDETLANLGAVVFLSDTVELFGSYSQGLSLADIGRVIANAQAPVQSAEQVASEVQEVDNYEIGVRGIGERYQASLAVFYSESENGTTFNPDLTIVKQPEEIWGMEAALDVQAAEQWRLGGTFTWIEGEVDLDNDGVFEAELPSTRVPPIKLTAYVAYQPLPWWNTRLQALYSGDREPDSMQFGSGEVDSYTLVDFYSSIEAGPGQLTFTVSNLLNNDYFPVISQAQAVSYAFNAGRGRTVSLGYAIEW